MSAKPCRGCGKMVVFAIDKDTGKWQVLDNVAPVFKQIGMKDGKPYVIRDKTAMVSHFATCPSANEFSATSRRDLPSAGPEQHFSEPKDVQ